MLPIVITTDQIVDADREIALIAELINRFGCRVHLRKKSCSLEQVDAYCRTLCEMIDTRLLTLHDFPQLVERYDLGGYHAKPHDIEYYGKKWGDKVIYSVSCHSMEEADNVADNVRYLFLSPIFDSISKHGYKSNFDKEILRHWLGKYHRAEIIALGGIESNNIEEVKELGFDGAALLGAIWNGDPIKQYENLIR